MNKKILAILIVLIKVLSVQEKISRVQGKALTT